MKIYVPGKRTAKPFIAHPKPENTLKKQIFLAMKLTALFITLAFMQVSAAVYSQKINITAKQVPLEQVLKQIEQQSGYQVLYSSELIQRSKPVTADIKNETLEIALKECFEEQPLTYEVAKKTILVKLKTPEELSLLDKLKNQIKTELAQIIVHGRVLDETGQPLPGVTIKIKNSDGATSTDRNGSFTITVPNDQTVLVFSYIGYEGQELAAKYIPNGSVIILKASTTNLREVTVNKGYYNEKRELSTGNVSTITAKEIEQQPVSNPLAALEGRVPGLMITQSTGVPGGSYKVLIRGQSSILNGSDPLYIVDGVPYNSEIPSPTGSRNGGLVNASFKGGNPLNYINPDDIENISVLKDADATAIYGSRGANGVILITTKKGKAGPMRINANVSSGISSPDRDIQLLNTQQYLTIRRQAFRNDKVIPTATSAPDLLFWDTNRYTNWSKVFLDNHPVYTDANLSISGGNTNTQYLIGGGYNRQTNGMPTLIPDAGADGKGSIHFNISNTSVDNKFHMSLTGSYVSDHNTIQTNDFSQDRLLNVPDAPPIFNPDGSLNWDPIVPGQVGTWSNPYAPLYEKYQGNTSNVIGDISMGYQILPNLELSAHAGYTNTQIDELQTFPTIINDPGNHVENGAAYFAETNSNSWIFEPQLNFKFHLGRGKLNALLGGSIHENNSSVKSFTGTGYTSDALLESVQSAGSISASSYNSQYKYNAIFARLDYNLDEKYLLNLTARRDGSSRFGPGKQFGNFGSVGGAWIFSRESFIENNLPFLSFGKLRGSYGVTGNDQIGDYQFLDLYTSTITPYGGTQGLYPYTLFNPALSWEIDKKLEAGIELGFLKNRINFELSWYRNRSGNQLVTTPISEVTGFTSIPSNLPALVQNTGIELQLNTTNVKSNNFAWTTVLTLTVPKNELLSFPGLANSPYANTLIIGQPITIKKLYHLVGVNPATGIYQFSSASGMPTYSPNSLTDKTSLVNTAPKFYGSFQNGFRYKNLSLDFMFQFVKQTGLNMFGSYARETGTMYNVPVAYLNYWQSPGDVSKYQMLSQSSSSLAGKELNFAKQSDFEYGDASYIRLKNVALSYDIQGAWKQKIHIQGCRVYLNGENLLTITKYDGIDPETQSVASPPKRVLVAGIQLTL